MKTILVFLSFLAFCFSAIAQSDFDFNVLAQPTTKAIILKTTFTHQGRKSIKIANPRTVDYVRDEITPLGNYAIEIQFRDGDKYIQFYPSADMDPQFNRTKYMPLKSGQSITDTLTIVPHTFSWGENDRGTDFRDGQYRIRMAFSIRPWGDKKLVYSDWKEFSISK